MVTALVFVNKEIKIIFTCLILLSNIYLQIFLGWRSGIHRYLVKTGSAIFSTDLSKIPCFARRTFIPPPALDILHFSGIFIELKTVVGNTQGRLHANLSQIWQKPVGYFTHKKILSGFWRVSLN